MNGLYNERGFCSEGVAPGGRPVNNLFQYLISSGVEAFKYGQLFCKKGDTLNTPNGR
jgi:hypothetical protein